MARPRAVSAFPIAKAGPAHIATLKTFDPPLSALHGEGFKGAERRANELRAAHDLAFGVDELPADIDVAFNLLGPAQTPATLAAITIPQLRAYHAQQFVTSRMLLVVVGIIAG